MGIIKFNLKKFFFFLKIKFKFFFFKRAEECFQIYCLKQAYVNGLDVCLRLNHKNPNAIGRQKTTGFCLIEDSPGSNGVERCCENQCCKLVNVCKLIEKRVNNFCNDDNGKCITDLAGCFSCPMDSCLDLAPTSPPPAKCVLLDSLPIPLCHSINGRCSLLTSGECISCPLSTCLDIKNGVCNPAELVDISQNSCLKAS